VDSLLVVGETSFLACFFIIGLADSVSICWVGVFFAMFFSVLSGGGGETSSMYFGVNMRMSEIRKNAKRVFLSIASLQGHVHQGEEGYT